MIISELDDKSAALMDGADFERRDGSFRSILGVEPLVRALNRRDSALRRSLVSGEKAADETPSTGGRRRLSLSNAFSAISKSGMRTPRVRIKKSATRDGWLISLWSIGESNP